MKKNTNQQGSKAPSNEELGEAKNSYWARWYIGVLLFLIIQIVIYGLITVEFKKF